MSGEDPGPGPRARRAAGRPAEHIPRPAQSARRMSAPRDGASSGGHAQHLPDVAVGSELGGRQAQASPTRARSDGLERALARLRLLGEVAREVGAALGLSAGDLATSEAFDRIERLCALSVEQASAIPAEAARRWFETLGADLSIDLALEGLDPTLDPVRAELRVGEDPAAALAEFQRATLAVAETQGESVTVSAQVGVTKTQAQPVAEQALAARRASRGAESLAPEAALVFYSAAACERMLTLRAVDLWRRRGLGDDEARLCVFLCDARGALAGPALEVLGAADDAALDDALVVSRAAWRRFVERAAAQRRLRAAESAWSGFTLALTPDHLRVVARARGLERIAGRLQTLRAQVAACALASHVEGVAANGAGDLTLRFAGARPALARLAGGAPPDDLEAQPRDALIELADWAYRDAAPEKLAIARQALADTLAAGATLSLAQLCVAAAPALDTAHANFAIYVRGATERYFQLRAAAQQTVSGFAADTRAAVASLTSDVTDNLFRTVGLIVGVAIGWLLQPSASLALLRIAAALYTLYVVFIALYLLRARYARYRLERKGLDDTLAAMSELAQAERDRLRLPARDAEAHFEHYYRLTRAIYWALAGIGALAFVALLTPLGHAFAR